MYHIRSICYAKIYITYMNYSVLFRIQKVTFDYCLLTLTIMGRTAFFKTDNFMKPT